MGPNTSPLSGEPPNEDPPASLPAFQAPEIDLSELTPVELLHESEDSRVVQARWKEKDCVLKICHYTERNSAVRVDYEVDPYLRESQAYCRLKAYGLCEKGHIPDFYGVIENIDLKTMGWKTYLEVFEGEPELPNAVVIEFIPDLRPFDLSHYTAERADQLQTTMSEIHDLGVQHGDVHQRNAKVHEETNRAIWIDFDRAIICPLDLKTEDKKKDWRRAMANEEELLLDALVNLAEDYKGGEIRWSWYWHYGVVDPFGWTEEDQEAKVAAYNAAKQGTLAAEAQSLVVLPDSDDDDDGAESTSHDGAEAEVESEGTQDVSKDEEEGY